MNSWVDLISWVCLLGGAFFAISGGVGILRFPDFFTRMHATGVTDTLCAALILLGLMFQAGWGVTLVKLFLILAFLLLTSPTATHALAKAALHGKLEPALEEKGESSSKS
jgi:multicomponent Na+:H+ antiporter subunit G